MRNFLFGLSISIAFIVGNLTAPRVSTTASAQAPTTQPVAAAGTTPVTRPPRWEYICTEGYSAKEITKRANAYGERNWELSAGAGAQGIWCFKRRLR